ncbi:MAG TPA: nucleotide sugar dehydrogenase [Vicinamibacterales bacterium]|nr:nucleotide sugar dehydrogenase [Vicinamibacterales bacterium]
MSRRVSVIGLGKLGASMAAAIASRGHEVIGVDISQAAVDAVNNGRAPVQETGLADLIAANHDRLRATRNHAEAILESDVSFVIVPTPSDARGAFKLQYAAYAFREIGRALAQKPGYHTVVLTSTVLPGASRHGLLPILERSSGKKCGDGFGFCYSPEFVALGDVVRGFLCPDFLLIGEFDRRSGDVLEAHYRDVIGNAAPAARMSIENAELAKVSVNAYVTTKITFANMLAEICDRMPGGDVDVVSNAIGLDSRIGRRYLTGALGYGGPCFPRDNVALGFFSSSLGAAADLPGTIDRLNRGIAERAVSRVIEKVHPGATVAVLGLAYKPHSHVVQESQAMQIVEALVDRQYRVLAFDPLAGHEASQALGGRALVLDSIEACLRDAEAVLIATPDPLFAQLSADDFTRGHQRPVRVIDFWRQLAPALQGAPGIEYVAYGRGGAERSGRNPLAELWQDAVAGFTEGV